MSQIIKVNGQELSTLVPSSVRQGDQVTRTAERSLNGSMHVDMSYRKATLEITWDGLEDAELDEVKNIFPNDGEISVELFGKTSSQAKFYLDSLDYIPMFLGGQLYWRNVTAKLVQM